ncbi:RagB/SusD family nutrient uptake outer membrane protein [Mucilaginibacter sp. KACC 22063]|uniref:RagB/SusD family nutrient uptake outer membrane protein n=1 Tax=Mucilaginibacter sp. KACC 22063 TaxID=3025666 RepID=UPI0023666AA7|nr:RagB/SusD family nutrient uptake outer membrane protein [Mucilaginibacter sp. KACC 22063]WDF56153.1 RagB/SusD family nutrient uptake outer membrane protein [Mucilaginibacter sp. KACC 22063]
MKNLTIKGITLTALLAVSSFGCKKVLDETPRSIFTPDYFKTTQGVNGGLTAMYYHLRNIYGQGYYYNSGVTGTDEATWGQSADGNFKDMDCSGVGVILSTSFPPSIPWGECFPDINTASGVIENASAAGVAPSLVAEARFFRAFDYFLLVQTYGGVPLDLGAGVLKFNTNAVRTSKRNTVPEVYSQAILPDLLQAVNDLPDKPRVTGGVTKTVARFYLAKAYLTYAWWLQNPNGIPTYPSANRTDPGGHDASYYFQKAYDTATSAIDNASLGGYALQPTFYDVNVATNDRNSEMLLYADHTQTSEKYNASSLTYGSGGAPDNFASWMLTWNYPNISVGGINPVQRESDQHLGRPWVRMAPTIEAIKNTFADKVNDSRYDGTFTTTYRANWPKGNTPNASINGANGLKIVPGDAVYTFLDNDNPAVTYAASGTGYANAGGGILPGRADYVVNPSNISRIAYPGIWKLGPYRTDSGTGLGQPNAGSTRPFPIAKLSELYLIAAEAVVKGAAPTAGRGARDLINVLRARAGKWRFSNNGNTTKVEDDSQAMIAATPATIDINYVLAERSREFFAEGNRWYDLVRTQKWAELAGSYTICGATFNDHNPVKVTRTIDNHLYLRPIPQGQIDALDMSAADKAAYQNPGY